MSKKDTKIWLQGITVTKLTGTKNWQIPKYKYFEAIKYGYALLYKVSKTLKDLFILSNFIYYNKIVKELLLLKGNYGNS